MLCIRQAHENEFLKVHDLISKVNTLESYPEHFFKIMLRYFQNTFFVAEKNDSIIGACWGFTSQTDKDTCFLWQIGVMSSYQGKGIGRKLLESFEGSLEKRGASRIELTIAPDNLASQKLFKSRGYKNISNSEKETIRIENVTAVKNYYRAGGHYMLFSKKL